MVATLIGYLVKTSPNALGNSHSNEYGTGPDRPTDRRLFEKRARSDRRRTTADRRRRREDSGTSRGGAGQPVDKTTREAQGTQVRRRLLGNMPGLERRTNADVPKPRFRRLHRIRYNPSSRHVLPSWARQPVCPAELADPTGTSGGLEKRWTPPADERTRGIASSPSPCNRSSQTCSPFLVM